MIDIINKSVLEQLFVSGVMRKLTGTGATKIKIRFFYLID